MPYLYGNVENWKSDAKLMPDASWGDMYRYLTGEYTHNNLKAYKSLEVFNFFVYNYVQDIYNNEIAKRSEFWILQYQNKGTKIFI